LEDARIRRSNAKSEQGAQAEPIQVLFVNHTAKAGGGELALRLLVQHLDRRLVQPQLVLFEDGPMAERFRETTHVHILPLSSGIRERRKDSLGAIRFNDFLQLFTLPAFIVRLSRMIAKLNVDVVHTNSLKADILGGIAARLAHKRVVWHVRDRIADDYLPSMTVRVFRRLARLIPHAIITNSRSTLESLRLPNNSGRATHRNPATVAHDGFDFSQLPVSMREPSPHLVIGLVGRISPWKGQDVFLRAIHRIHLEFPEARFQIIGSALFGEQQYADHIHALCAELGIEHCVEFCGFIRDIHQHIATLDILVHASTIPEPFGQVVIEGMAAGKPIVATRAGGVAEIVVDEDSGLLVPMNDPEALASALRRLIESPDLRARLGVAGRQRVQETFRIEFTAAKVSRVYSELCER